MGIGFDLLAAFSIHQYKDVNMNFLNFDKQKPDKWIHQNLATMFWSFL